MVDQLPEGPASRLAEIGEVDLAERPIGGRLPPRNLKWREAGERERLWVIDRAHPIADGLREGFALDEEEMYGEAFDVPAPDQLVLISWFEGGEVFRSGCCWSRGRGRIFYFRPGHETHPTYIQPAVRRVIANAAHWAAGPRGAPIVLANQEAAEAIQRR